jgi:hypothetical protein
VTTDPFIIERPGEQSELNLKFFYIILRGFTATTCSYYYSSGESYKRAKVLGSVLRYLSFEFNSAFLCIVRNLNVLLRMTFTGGPFKSIIRFLLVKLRLDSVPQTVTQTLKYLRV